MIIPIYLLCFSNGMFQLECLHFVPILKIICFFCISVRYNGDGSRWQGIDDGAPPDVVGDFRHEEVKFIHQMCFVFYLKGSV